MLRFLKELTISQVITVLTLAGTVGMAYAALLAKDNELDLRLSAAEGRIEAINQKSGEIMETLVELRTDMKYVRTLLGRQFYEQEYQRRD